MKLFGPDWKNGDTEKALLAVQKITDAGELKKIVIEDRRNAVRLAALNKISDTAFLVDRIKNDYDKEIKTKAMERIGDQDVLVDIAIGHGNINTRLSVVDHISDPKCLAKIAGSDNYHNSVLHEICKRAIGKINDDAVLSGIVLTDYPFEMRTLAVQEIRNESVLADIVKKDDNPNIYQKAVDNIINMDILAGWVCDSACDWNKQALIIEKLDAGKYQALFAKIANSGMDVPVRSAAIKKLTDSTVLAGIAASDPDNGIKKIASGKLGGYVCRKCSHLNYPSKEAEAPCVCENCKEENHDYEYKEDIHTFRDYETGSKWYECRRCGKKDRYETVNTL
ncbi:MAG: hypothetical protein LBB82_09650 [Treponema sp.]|nr:hypothetical protein [Treponema sp.]